jgi:hypothetical protein
MPIGTPNPNPFHFSVMDPGKGSYGVNAAATPGQSYGLQQSYGLAPNRGAYGMQGAQGQMVTPGQGAYGTPGAQGSMQQLTSQQYNPLGHGDAGSVTSTYGIYGTEGGKGSTAVFNPQWDQWFKTIRANQQARGNYDPKQGISLGGLEGLGANNAGWFSASGKAIPTGITPGAQSATLGGWTGYKNASSAARSKAAQAAGLDDGTVAGYATAKANEKAPDYAQSMAQYGQGKAGLMDIGRGSQDWYSLSPAQRTAILSQK